jgi:quinol monooxygenase YgiN
MFFKEEHVPDFLEIFEESKSKIRNTKGCLRLDLLQDYGQEHIFTTYSYWEDLKSLDRYRHSELFLDNWSKMKQYFSAKPMAFSCKKISTSTLKEIQQKE